MPVFDFKNLPELTEEAKRYCRYYQIDFCDTLPDVNHYLGSFDSLGYRMAMHYYLPKTIKGTVFIFHGYFDHVGLYGHLIKHCLEQNLAVIAYDLPGHGLSSGRPTAIKSFDDYQLALKSCVTLCQDNITAPFYGIGQSTGGAVLIDHLLNRTQQFAEPFFEKVVLLAPLVRPMGWKGALFMHSVVGPFISTWKRVFSENSNDPVFIKFLKKHDPLQSRIMSIEWITALRLWIRAIESTGSIKGHVSIVQGKRDMTVDWRHNITVLQQKFSEVDVHYLPKGRHHLVNESEEIRQDVFNYIDGVLASS
ncbi:alpha/beta hydrolase [Alkalimarinus alittae]|uniref:Alpha/beta hydrolase n=1 Tax=Alkalimarinus alittae TaxID=2961619 RepID=A0ABY6N002_9ALTE|nr:alpha/beta hydrolase [Alkalimarinus alittae]UZE95414.1 alpha/beta hydrolase [Alkalimarinus alittae]